MPVCGAEGLEAEADLCVIGAGPAGLALAFDAHDRGMRALVLEAGGRGPDPSDHPMISAEIVNPAAHAPVEVATSPAIGGTSHWWGGRAVPLDPADFTPCPGLPEWPIEYEDLLPWWEAAARFLGCHDVHEMPSPGAFARLPDHSASHAESWGAELNMARRWQGRLEGTDGPLIVPRARAVGFKTDQGRISVVRVLHNGLEQTLRARHVVLACGGLGVMKLLLNAEHQTPGLLAGAAHLGVGYMGHLTGSIADLVPANPKDIAAFGCLPAGDGAVVRRRIMPSVDLQAASGIGNIAFWLDNPPLGDPAHGSGALSAKYLLLRQASLGRRLVREGLRVLALRGAEGPVGPHLANIARQPLGTVTGLGRAAVSRLTDRYRRPEYLASSGPGSWRLHYHAEQRFDPANQVTLSDRKDPAGLYRLKIEYRFAEADYTSVLRAHELLDADLRVASAGALRFLDTPEECLERVRDAASDGYHQIGGTRMGQSAVEGVVDPDCRVHGLENLWVTSSSTFVSAGQANPTLTIVALACRLAAHLSSLR